jgi:hypothetical protein
MNATRGDQDRLPAATTRRGDHGLLGKRVSIGQFIEPALDVDRDRVPYQGPDRAWVEALAGRSDEELRAAGVYTLARMQQPRWWSDPERAVLRALAQRRLDWTQPEVALLFDLAADRLDQEQWQRERLDFDPPLFVDLLRLPVAAAERLGASERGLLEPRIRWAITAVEGAPVRRDDIARIRYLDRLRGLQLGFAPVYPRMLAPEVLPDGDPFSDAARRDLGERLLAPGIPELLNHCATAIESSTPPTKAWPRIALHLLDAAADGVTVLRVLLDLLTTPARWAMPAPTRQRAGVTVGEENSKLLRGAVWALRQVHAAWVTPYLGEVALAAISNDPLAGRYPRCGRVAVAVVDRLRTQADEEAMLYLLRLLAAARDRGMRNVVRRALERVAARSGLIPADLAGRLVPALGAKPGGQGGALRQALVAERGRLERLLACQLTWDVGDWRERYLGHPLTGTHARLLVWQVQQDSDRWWSGMPVRVGGAWRLEGPAGEPIRFGDHGWRVRLWHPLLAPVEETVAWREVIAARRIRQPFEQAFRGLYRLTPAEEQTRVYSNRFAAHVIRYARAAALMGRRGWTVKWLGHGDAEARWTSPDGRWRARFFFDLLDTVGREPLTTALCTTDQVRFDQRLRGAWRPAELTAIPPLVFSEAMRDVDAFLSASSIAADTTWVDRGENRYVAYWQRTSFGELTQRASTRRQVLARLLPALDVADRLEIGDRFLRVRGTLRIYKIHLGSGNILMEPDDSYLCIVTARSPEAARQLMLPFEDDNMLAIIVSKAVLLAKDEEITDPTITSQILAGG